MKARLVALMCMIALVVTMIPFNMVYATSTAQKGIKIEVNKDYEGVLDTETEVDWYTVNITQKGYFQVSLDYDDAEESLVNDGWDIVIFDADEKEIKEIRQITSKYASPQLPFAPGTYYVKIKANWEYAPGAPIGCTYNLRVNNTYDDAWESEYNDSRSMANAIIAGHTHYGTIYCAEDIDWYKVDINQNGYFQLDFDYDDRDEDIVNDGWNVTICDVDGNVIKEFTKITKKYNSARIPFAPGTYYVKVMANWQYEGGAPIDCTYKLKVSNTVSAIWESENNETMATADKIVLNSKSYYCGNLYAADDVDYFYFSLQNKGAIKILFKANDVSTLPDEKYGWDVTIFNINNGKQYQLDNVKGLTTKAVVLPQGKYYVKVNADWQYVGAAPIDCTYNVKVNYVKTPAKTIIKNLTTAKRAVTVKWNKKSNASGYVIYRATSKNGAYKQVAKIANKNTTSITFKKLKKGKRYYFKIRTYRTYNGVTAYSDMSKASS